MCPAEPWASSGICKVSVNTNAGHRMRECSKAVNVSAIIASQLVWLMPGIQVVHGLCLGACWDLLSTGDGGGSGEHLRGNYISELSHSETALPLSGLKAVRVRVCNYVTHFFFSLKTLKKHSELAELLQRHGI